MQPNLLPVTFHNTVLFLVAFDGQPYVPMKPVVEGMGLDWKTQYRKLTENQRFATCIVEMTMQMPDDDQRRAMTCLPLRKLPGWLLSIYPNKVTPELRDTVMRYQEECDDVLWQHWSQQLPVAKPLSLAEQALQSAQVLVALEQEQLRLAENQAVLEAKTSQVEAKTATLEATLAETTQRYDTKIADLQVQHRNGIPLHHLSKSQAHHAYAKGLSEKVFHVMLAYAKIPTQEYTHLTEEGQPVVTFAYLPDAIPEALKSLVQNSTQVSACYCESKDLKLRFRCQQAAWLAD